MNKNRSIQLKVNTQSHRKKATNTSSAKTTNKLSFATLKLSKSITPMLSSSPIVFNKLNQALHVNSLSANTKKLSMMH